MQFNPYQTQLSPLKLTIFFILVISSKFMHLVKFKPLYSRAFSSLMIDFGFLQLSL